MSARPSTASSSREKEKEVNVQVILRLRCGANRASGFAARLCCICLAQCAFVIALCVRPRDALFLQARERGRNQGPRPAGGSRV